MEINQINSPEPLRILVHAPLGVGGVTNVMLNIQRNIDRSVLNFDYLVFHNRVEPQENAAYELGSKKLVASADEIKIKSLRWVVRSFRVRKVCKENNVKILHLNGGAPMGLFTILAAKAGGVQYVTFHSHNGGTKSKSRLVRMLNAACKPFLPLVVDEFWACSDLAASFSFPKNIAQQKRYCFIPNAIKLKEYEYNEEVRKCVREELELTNKFVVGHAGRFDYQKNHTFLIDIFKVLHDKEPTAVLILFGVGELQESIREKVRSLNLEDCVRFYGASDKMSRMYQAMDVFLMPSKFEGLPVTGIEAEAAALPIVFSDVITRDVEITDNVCYVSLKESADVWAETVLKYKGIKRVNQIDKLKNAGFDMPTVVERFQSYYVQVARKLNLM